MTKNYFHITRGEYYAILASPTSVDAVGFRARRAGLEIRDSICILRPEGPMFALLARGPLKSTVVDEVVRRGTGVIGIDVCRISTGDNLNGGAYAKNSEFPDKRRWEGGPLTNNAGEYKQPSGRFPANLILVHGEGCVGTKKVRGSRLDHDCGKFGDNGIYNQGTRKMRFTGYTGEDGKEVANWVCEPGCPVGVLDAQSGTSKSGPLQPVDNSNWKSKLFDDARGWNSHSMIAGNQNAPQGYGDTGGASRFFYQATSLDDLESYLVRLVGNDPKPNDGEE